MKRKMTSYTDAQRLEGIKLSDEIGATKAARQLNVQKGTLRGWLSRRKKYETPKASKTPRIAPRRANVKHSSVTPNGGPAVTASAKNERRHVVISPNGFRVEGLTLPEATMLLKQ